MYLDQFLLDELKDVGKDLLKKAKIRKCPKNIGEMYHFFSTVSKEVENESFDGLLVGTVLYNFVSSVEVRDRLTTSRTFEDIFGNLFNVPPTDLGHRENPSVPEDILALDSLCDNEDWLISTDLSGNKREKTDICLGNYNLSLKTLKGKVYDENMNIIDTNFNSEVNVGSLSYRALLKGILDDESVSKLKDRKGGLGSRQQIRENMFEPINALGKHDIFYHRLDLFLHYVYEDDFVLILKSNYKIIFYFIPNKSYVDAFLRGYNDSTYKFENLWSRWENNNLRIQWPELLHLFDKYDLTYYSCEINLSKATRSKTMEMFSKKMKKFVSDSVNEMIKNFNR